LWPKLLLLQEMQKALLSIVQPAVAAAAAAAAASAAGSVNSGLCALKPSAGQR
jgi:hypothetical protein